MTGKLKIDTTSINWILFTWYRVYKEEMKSKKKQRANE